MKARPSWVIENDKTGFRYGVLEKERKEFIFYPKSESFSLNQLKEIIKFIEEIIKMETK